MEQQRTKSIPSTEPAGNGPARVLNIVYEYQAWQDGRWVTLSIADAEQVAIGMAQHDLIDNRQHKVRVLRTRDGGAEDMSSRVVYKRETEPTGEKHNGVALGRPPANSPVCHDPHDLFEPKARLTLNRLLRDYCLEQQVTATELLHDHRRLNRLLAQPSLIAQAINQVARVQVSSRHLTMRRRQTLMDLVQQAGDICQGLPHATSDETATQQLERHLDRLAGDELPSHEAASQRRLMGAALADLIRRRPGTVERLHFALDLLDKSTHGSLDRLIDLLLADLVYTTELPEILTGLAGNLGERLIRLLRLATGTEMEEDGKRPTKDAALNAAISRLRLGLKQGRLPIFRQHVIDHVTLALEQAPALEARDEMLDDALYRQVVETAGRYYRLLDDPGFVEAITRRFSRHSEIASNNRVAAARNVAAILHQPAIAILYWANLYKLSDDYDLRKVLVNQIREALEPSLDLHILLPGRLSHSARLARMKATHQAVERMPIAPEWRREILGMLDEAIWQYLAQQGFLTDGSSGNRETLRDRAFRLADFCQNGLLPEGKALQQAQERLRKLVTRPGFDQAFTADIADPVMAEAARKAFRQRLQQAGIKF